MSGGSQGLGKAIATALLKRGCDVLIVARTLEKLQKAAEDLEKFKQNPSQKIYLESADLSDPAQAERVIKSAARTPDIILCCAGSCVPGLFVDLSSAQISSGIRSNYLTSLYLSHAGVKAMLADKSSSTDSRHIVFVSSILAFLGQTAYSSYSPSKAALRSLTDSLRQELLLYGDAIKVHCAFPATIFGEAFEEEKRLRPKIVDILEESDAGQAPEIVCDKILEGLDRGYVLIETEFNGTLLRNGMLGPSPRNNVIWDILLQFAAFLAWPFVRYDFDRKVKKYGRRT